MSIVPPGLGEGHRISRDDAIGGHVGEGGVVHALFHLDGDLIGGVSTQLERPRPFHHDNPLDCFMLSETKNAGIWKALDQWPYPCALWTWR